MDWKEIKPVNPKGNQPWIFIGRIDAEVETPILWPADRKSWLFGNHPDAGKDWRQEEKMATEDEMVGWHHLLNWHKFEQTPGDSEKQGSLAYCCPLGSKEWDTTYWLNMTYQLNNSKNMQLKKIKRRRRRKRTSGRSWKFWQRYLWMGQRVAGWHLKHGSRESPY